jgi:hypothetical protein
MRITYTGPTACFDAAMLIVSREMVYWEARYTKVGWGWQFNGRYHPDGEFFVRRLKDGLSVKCTRDPAETSASSPSAEGAGAGKDARDDPET